MANKDHSLKGKRIVVLGGSSGLGFETARATAAEEASVVVVSGNQQRINEAVAILPAGTEGHAADLRNEEVISRLFGRLGAFDHLVYTAGENLNLKLIADTDLAATRDFFTLRFWGAVAAVKWAAPHIKSGGSISLMSGTASMRPGKGWSVASAICGAVEGFTRAMAVELAPVRVNCVVPGVIRTGLWDSMTEKDRNAMYTSAATNLLLKRVGEAEDVAAGFIYLMKQSYATGQSLVIDGGTLLV